MPTPPFTIDQIKAAHSKVKSGADFPQYIRDLKQLGVVSYETFVADGHTDYTGHNNYKAGSPAKYNSLVVNNTSDADTFKADLKAHQQGKSDYPTWCRQTAQAGIEKWIVSLEKMTCTYFDKAGEIILIENIPG
jgi:uncharacterized protein YbcV (DUF1398 family)